MKFPKLKHPLLCRITSYVVVLGAWLVPMIAAVCIPVIPEAVKAVVSLLCTVGLLVCLFRNFGILIALDLGLAVMQGYTKAYRKYPLQLNVEALEKRLSRFGKACEPTALQPKPHMLRIKSTAPITVYSSGIEKVVAVYRCGLLTKDEYQTILNSAVANSQALAGKKKHLLLDKEQKQQPLNRATMILILATAVEPGLSQELYDLVCKKEGDGYDAAVLPCVVDQSAKSCVFNSLRLPYWGMQYPVKNRGLRLTEKLLFNGKLPKGQGKLLEELEGHDPEKTLWQFWRDLKKEWCEDDRKTKRRLDKMSHGQIIVEDDELLLKWEERGIAWAIHHEDEAESLTIDAFDNWDYPKIRPMSKKHFAAVKDKITDHFAQEGCSVRFVTLEDTSL